MVLSITFSITEKLRKLLEFETLPYLSIEDYQDKNQIFFAVNFDYVADEQLYLFSILNEKTEEFLMIPIDSTTLNSVENELDFGTTLMDLLYDAFHHGGIAFNKKWSEELMDFFSKGPDNFRFAKLTNDIKEETFITNPISKLVGLQKSYKRKLMAIHKDNMREDIINFVFSRKLLRYFKKQNQFTLMPRDIPVQTLFQITYQIIQDRVHIYIINPLDQVLMSFEFSKYHKPSFDELVIKIKTVIGETADSHNGHTHRSFAAYDKTQERRLLDGSKLNFAFFETLIENQTF